MSIHGRSNGRILFWILVWRLASVKTDLMSWTRVVVLKWMQALRKYGHWVDNVCNELNIAEIEPLDAGEDVCQEGDIRVVKGNVQEPRQLRPVGNSMSR